MPRHHCPRLLPLGPFDEVLVVVSDLSARRRRRARTHGGRRLKVSDTSLPVNSVTDNAFVLWQRLIDGDSGRPAKEFLPHLLRRQRSSNLPLSDVYISYADKKEEAAIGPGAAMAEKDDVELHCFLVSFIRWRERSFHGCPCQIDFM